MRFIRYILFTFILFIWVSCRPEGVNNLPVDPEIPIIDPGEVESPSKDDFISYISIDGRKYIISSASYYHDVEKSGFDIVLSSSQINIEGSLFKLPDDATIYIDVPDCDMNFISNLPTIIQGENWSFYFGYSENGEQAVVDTYYDIRSSSIKAGKMSVFFKSGVLELDFHAELNTGVVVVCKYKGEPVKSLEYIYCWNS